MVYRLPFAAALIALFLGAGAFAAKPKKAPEGENAEASAEQPKPVKGKKPVDAAGKIESQLQKTFKIWDRNKDDSIDKEELEKFYARLKAKRKKKGQGDEAQAPDPMAAVAALHAKIDADQDAKASHAEFDAWAADLSAHLSKYVELQERRAELAGELANLQGLLQRSGNVTAADGIFNGEASRGVIQYEQMIKGVDEDLKKLDEDSGHADYRDFLLQQVFRGKRR